MIDEDRLPYEFDLIYDIKYMSEIESIFNGDPSHSDASIQDLIDLLHDKSIPLPEFLNGAARTRIVYINLNGTWQEDKPDDMSGFAKTKVLFN